MHSGWLIDMPDSKGRTPKALVVYLVSEISSKPMKNMKKQMFLGVLAMGVLFPALSHNPERHLYDWHTNLEDALQTAREHDKNVMVFFAGTDWCGWCDRLTLEVFETDRFIHFLDENLVPVLIDFPRSLPMSREQRDQNRRIGEEFGIRGFPTVLILDPARQEVFRTGYRRGGVDGYILHLLPYVR
jgi:thioredoxin-related protein